MQPKVANNVEPNETNDSDRRSRMSRSVSDPMTADCHLETANCRLLTADCGLKGANDSDRRSQMTHTKYAYNKNVVG